MSLRVWTNRIGLSSALLSLAAVACGPPTPVAIGSDAGEDAGLQGDSGGHPTDSGPSKDGGADGFSGNDAGKDAGSAGSDGAVDGTTASDSGGPGSDATPDGTMTGDGGSDAGSDGSSSDGGAATGDSGGDSGSDSASDAGFDSAVDAGSDSASDARADAGPATDAASDAGNDTGTDSGPSAEPISVTVAPTGATFLTCSHVQFDAAVAPTNASQSVLWDASVGTISATGIFTAPVAAGPATITATSAVDGAIVGESNDTLVQFDLQDAAIVTPPELASIFGGSQYTIAYTHAMGSNGDVVYAPFPVVTGGGQTALAVWRSSNGGKSFSVATSAAITLGVGDVIDQWSVAVDAVDPNTVYVALVTEGTGTGWVGDNSVASLLFLVSSNGGSTFKSGVVFSQHDGAAGAYWPDVVSPAGGSVELMTSDSYWGEFWLWGDKTGGLALTQPTLDFDNPIGNSFPGFVGFPGGDGGVNCNGGDSGIPQQCAFAPVGNGAIATNSSYVPKLFTDSNGTICLAYSETMVVVPTDGGPAWWEPVAQCSPDLGATWGSIIHFTPTFPNGGQFSYVSGAAKPAGDAGDVIALAWTENVDALSDGGSGPALHVATLTTHPASPNPSAVVTSHSTADGGLQLPGQSLLNPFPTTDVRFDLNGVLWMTYYVAAESTPEPGIAVDKSCDNGATWTGGTYVGSIADTGGWPGLVPFSSGVTGGMGISSIWGGSPLTDAGVGTTAPLFYRLSP